MTTDSRLQPAEIVGGQIAPSPIPWQVSVQIEGNHICGGTILDTYTVFCLHVFFSRFSKKRVSRGPPVLFRKIRSKHETYLE